MSISSYTQVAREVAEGRSLQAQVLIRCARRLQEAITGTDLDKLFTAVSLNHKLWLLFYSEIEEKKVSLPPEVENNIRTLTAYVVNVTPRAFARDKEILESLVTINRRIAAGLSVTPGASDLADCAPERPSSKLVTEA